MASAVGGCSWTQMKGFSSPRRKSGKFQRNNGNNRKGLRVSCGASSAAVGDPYKTLSIHHGASESEVKRAFRKLALQYHPDVCRGSNCGVQFHQINEAYDIVMRHLRGELRLEEEPSYYEEDEWTNGQDLWEEWMGWEGAGIRDYSSHINPYI